MINLLNLALGNDATFNKGYILDLPLTFSEGQVDWIDSIIKNKVILPKQGCRYFSHIIEFNNTDEDALHFATNIMEKNSEVVKLYSEIEREISRKPKKVPVEGEEEEQEEPVEEEGNEEDKQPLIDSDLLFRPNEDLELLQQHNNQYNTLTKARASEFLQHLTKKEHIIIESIGFSDIELV